MPSPVIDLSHHNPAPNWAMLKQWGVLAVILKCTENVSYLDPTWNDRAKAAKAAGLMLAPYHFLHAGNVPNQMDWFLSQAQPPHGGRLVIDHEADASLDELCAAVTTLQKRRPDVHITIYSGHTIKEQLGASLRRKELADTSLWIAQYTSADAPSWPKQQWPNWSLWQWTDKETVAGISQPVDGNKWNGSAESLVRFMSPTSEQPQPAPEPDDYDQAWISIQTSPGVKIMINGREFSA